MRLQHNFEEMNNSYTRGTYKSRVTHILRDLGIESAPVPVERIAQKLGAQVRFGPFDGDLSGLIFREKGEESGEEVTIIGVNSRHAPTRRRFTVAHEIGHLLLGHLDLNEGDLHIDHKFFYKGRSARSAQGVDPEEINANAFAAELLMPERFLRHDFEKFRADSIEFFDLEDGELASALAERYKVSLQTMIIRLTKLGLIETGDAS